MSVMFLLSVRTGSCTQPPAVCRPFCSGTDCITVNQHRVDFPTAEAACRDMNGQLMTFQSEADESTLGIFNQGLYGSFWIGLRLPAAACSNLSAPLRGYQWTSAGEHRSFIPSSSTWKHSVRVCSPRCVSLSHDQKWTERPCSDTADGFLCKTKHKDACRAQGLSDQNVIKSSKRCTDAPCQHSCKDVKGGYICSCFKGYIPDSKDPQRCRIHCAQQKCPPVCELGSCSCADGFILSETLCEDINECENYGCDQECKNTFGSFSCSCRKGFVLKDEVKCVKAKDGEGSVVTTPVVTSVVKPVGNHTVKGSTAPAGGFLWVWVLLVVAVVVFIVVIRFHVVKRQKRREQISSQQSAAPVDSIQYKIWLLEFVTFLWWLQERLWFF